MPRTQQCLYGVMASDFCITTGTGTYLVNEAEVVADKDKAAIEGLDGLCQSINALNVQVVGGLVQQQQVRALHADHAEHQARLLALRQLPNLSCLRIAKASAHHSCARPTAQHAQASL